ncbi:putative disease resistance protein RGA3 [Nymphaea colorata]|uniref:AAA+ ATPase domain-containing protein n=1 Tax=Nymphaea colorata TaxID=210225 RepID=A0A5K0VGU6_9MAGN|nr:putative disease resistance protein RGA3 [Nymphaea colorata]
MEGVVSILLEKLTDLWFGKAEELASVSGELLKLGSQLKAIQPLLEDAHDKQFASAHIKEWISRLNEVLYDAEDVIDLYRVRIESNSVDARGEKRKVTKFLPSFSECRNLPFLSEISSEIKAINERLSMIWKEKDLYGLVPLVGDRSRSPQHTAEVYPNRQTTSYITEPHVYGRERDEELIIEWLKKEVCEGRGENARVIAIVGMGGVGKTTLAKKAYNNSSIKEHFEKFMWVCASEIPQALHLFKHVLEAAGGKESGADKIMGLNVLHSEISQHLKEKKFLLVLDDVWNDDWWTELNGLLQVGALGSRVLVTTREKSVAETMDAAYLHDLKCLSDEESWNLFISKTLRRNELIVDLARVEDIGRIIVGKCRGLPLALGLVASMLRHKKRERPIWQEVVSSPLWSWKQSNNENSIISAIALSYMSLPFALKQCLTYLCTFPKDFKIEKHFLLRLWEAEGFVSKDGVDTEALAGQYLEALANCSLVQVEQYKTTYYRLHDIVHDFATYIRGHDCADAASLTSATVSHQPRFFFSSRYDPCPTDDALRRLTKLRTLLMIRGGRLLPMTIVSKLNWLRVLDVSYSSISELPESLGNLVLLKYLNVSHTRICSLPESIVKLGDLQRLDLDSTSIKELPRGISQLRALRHVHLENAYSLEFLPKEMGRLTCLLTLSNFLVGSRRLGECGSSIRELCHLNCLRGKIAIENIERVRSKEEAKEAELEKKIYLECLRLSCDWKCTQNFDRRAAEKVQDIYEELQPPMSLKKLEIYNYGGLTLPTWFNSTTYYGLEDVTLYNCKFLVELPMLGLLPNLVKLEIEGASSVKIIDNRFHHSFGEVGFPRIEELVIRDMKSLEEWSFNADGRTMPRLRNLTVYDCPKLRRLPDGLQLNRLHKLKMKNLFMLDSICLTSLENMRKLKLCALNKINIRGLHGLKTANMLQKLDLKGLPKLDVESKSLEQALQVMNQVTVLILQDCHTVAESVADVFRCHHLPNLRLLKIFSTVSLMDDMDRGRSSVAFELEVDCVEMGVRLSGFGNIGDRVGHLCIRLSNEVDYLPEWIQHLHQLHYLEIRDSPRLSCLSDWLGKLSKLQRLRLYNLPELRGLPDKMEALTQLQELKIQEIPRLTHLPTWLGKLSKLQRLALENLSELRSLWDEINTLTQLEQLFIYNIPKLTNLPEWLGKLSKLQGLYLWHLPELRSLPEGMKNLTQLQELEIKYIPRLAPLPDWLGNLSKFRRISFYHLPQLNDTIPHSI